MQIHIHTNNMLGDTQRLEDPNGQLLGIEIPLKGQGRIILSGGRKLLDILRDATEQLEAYYREHPHAQ